MVSILLILSLSLPFLSNSAHSLFILIFFLIPSPLHISGCLHFIFFFSPSPSPSSLCCSLSLNSPEDCIVDHDLLWFDPHLHSLPLTNIHKFWEQREHRVRVYKDKCSIVPVSEFIWRTEGVAGGSDKLRCLGGRHQYLLLHLHPLFWVYTWSMALVPWLLCTIGEWSKGERDGRSKGVTVSEREGGEEPHNL